MAVRRGGAIAAILLGALAVAPAAAHANKFPVSTTADSGDGSLRKAITDANASGGPDVIPITARGTIKLASALPAITGDVEIDGPGSAALTVLRTSGGSYRIFQILAPAVVSISDLTVSDGRLTANLSEGAGVNSTGDLTLERVVVSDNAIDVNAAVSSPQAEGGGIWASGALHLDRTTVTGNSVSVTGGSSNDFSEGGGVFLAGGVHEIERSTVNGNTATATAAAAATASASGGGIDANGTTTIERDTISGNAVVATGGAADFGRGGGVRSIAGFSATSSTITANSAPDEPDIPSANLFAVGTNTFRNVIVSDPLGGAGNCFGTTSGGFNMEDGTSCGFTLPTDQSGTDPMINPVLASNGGTTKTHALLAGSPAIDRGNGFGETTDQRGRARPSDFATIANAPGGDGSDVGAFEAEAPPTPPQSPAAPDTDPPETTIDKAPRRRTTKRKASLRFSSDEPGSRFECKLDKGDFEPCTSPLKLKHLKRHRHRLQVRAIDPAGNADPTPAIGKWRVRRR